ncbi:MAG: glycosyltransferase family 2 protein [Solidesulfovibrio sp.]|uniref:glycosyltransferase family 2 protein n=1 Tax=Solidesulfovibrio sp. TaxID=2910990 RepID=UPI00315880C8
MGKLTYLRPRRGDIRPVLLLLTSHRLDCFLICTRCLERFTDFSRLKHVYVVANALSPDHLAVARRFVARHANASLVERGPRGLVPAVHAAQNEILASHLEDVIIKIDEDLFVTPHWLEHLVDGYIDHADRPDVPLVMPLVPVSPPGRHVLNRFLRVSYPSERPMYCGPPIEENWVYHRWMWEKLLHENLAEVYLRDGPAKYGYVGYLTINCVIFDDRIMRRVLPFPTSPTAGQATTDERSINLALATDRMKVAVLGRSLAHHYSFSKCEDYLRSHVPLEAVWRYMQGIAEVPPVAGRRCRGPATGAAELTLLRAGG